MTDTREARAIRIAELERSNLEARIRFERDRARYEAAMRATQSALALYIDTVLAAPWRALAAEIRARG